MLDRFNKEQKSFFKIKSCGAVHGGECFLIMTDAVNILVDSGYGFCAEKTAENIKKHLGDKPLDYLLLTHSHYDHAMGSAQIALEYPKLKIIASEYCKTILEKPSARLAIRKMDVSAAKIYGFPEPEDLTEKLRVDIALKDGEEFMLGDDLIQAVSLPGHTKCCMGYYFVNQKFMVSCETIGLYAEFGTVLPGCLVGYQMTVDSCRKIRSYEINEMLISHSGMLYGDDIYTFLDKARESTDECKDFIIDAWKNGLDLRQSIESYKKKYYTDDIAEFYPEPALVANLSAQIPMFIKECGQSR